MGGTTSAASRRSLARGPAISALAALGVSLAAACFSSGTDEPPPQAAFYYPVGLAVSAAGNVLYAVNADYDLQYSGGTVQSYDLTAIRNDAVGSLLGISAGTSGTGYWKDTVTIGTLATDLRLTRNGGRLFVPVQGDTSLTWIDVRSDDDPRYIDGSAPNASAASYPPFFLDCDRNSEDVCDSLHHAGQATDPGNTRQLTMPSDPFAIALSDDDTAIAVTHQGESETSLFLTGFVAMPSSADAGQGSFDPSIEFIVDQMPKGGDGIVSVPHDPAAITSPDPASPLRPAFLQTSNQAAEIDLVRYYSDEGYLDDGGTTGTAQLGSSNFRPFLVKERAFSVSVTSSASNGRGIAIDPTPRMACEWNVTSALGLPTTSPQYVACAQLPARVFIASTSPDSLVLGQIGAMGSDGTTYDPDQLTIAGDVPLPAGPSQVYVAPIVDANGLFAVRVFVVCFDSQTVVIYDPDAQRIENEISTGQGPFAMAFDPFDLSTVAARASVPYDSRSKYTTLSNGQPAGPALRSYRFAYIASFTDSFVQVVDLDESFHDDRLGAGKSTFEDVVYAVGAPTPPVSSN
jgi:DNA-binding beta-propeller fold protein YncE